MSDGIAPAIDKVGDPEPKAPEAQANAPTMDTTAPASEDSKPEEKPEEKKLEEKTEEKKPEEQKSEEAKPSAAAELGHKLPKPVEVMSVPQTPLNDQTPAGGTPRPELKIDEEPNDKPKEEAQVILGPGDTNAATKDKTSVEPETNGQDEDTEIKDAPASETSSESTKRKIDEEPAPTTTANGDAPDQEKTDSNERAGKKARVEDAPESAPAKPAATNGKVGRPKKDKKAAPSVGRTARKTRSQGPVEALGV